MMRRISGAIYFLLLAPVLTHAASAPDKLVGIHSARVMSQSLPWMAEEAGLFKKHNIDFNLVFISSSSIVTAALLGGDEFEVVHATLDNAAGSASRRKGSNDIGRIPGRRG